MAVAEAEVKTWALVDGECCAPVVEVALCSISVFVQGPIRSEAWLIKSALSRYSYGEGIAANHGVDPNDGKSVKGKQNKVSALHREVVLM